MKLSANTSYENDRVLVETMETSFRKCMEHCLKFSHSSLTSNTLCSVYYNVVRREEKTKNLDPTMKYKQDMAFLTDLLKKARVLDKHSLYMWWFPNDIQVEIEPLLSRKPMDLDMAGLLGLITFAGIDLNETEDTYFNNQMIQKAFLPKEPIDKFNLLFESQQNLATLLFGITLDKVRKTSLTLAKYSVLTVLFFRRVLVFRECSRMLPEQKDVSEYSPKKKISEAK